MIFFTTQTSPQNNSKGKMTMMAGSFNETSQVAVVDAKSIFFLPWEVAG